MVDESVGEASVVSLNAAEGEEVDPCVDHLSRCLDQVLRSIFPKHSIPKTFQIAKSAQNRYQNPTIPNISRIDKSHFQKIDI